MAKKINNNQQQARHNIWKYWTNPGTGAVYGPGDGNYVPDGTGSINGITFSGSSATITKSAVYALGSSIQVTDVPQPIVPYFDFVLPVGWQGMTGTTNMSTGYDPARPVNNVNVGTYTQHFVTLYLPAGTTIQPRYAHRGSQNTRIGGGRTAGFWFAEEVR